MSSGSQDVVFFNDDLMLAMSPTLCQADLLALRACCSKTRDTVDHLPTWSHLMRLRRAGVRRRVDQERLEQHVAAQPTPFGRFLIAHRYKRWMMMKCHTKLLRGRVSAHSWISLTMLTHFEGKRSCQVCPAVALWLARILSRIPEEGATSETAGAALLRSLPPAPQCEHDSGQFAAVQSVLRYRDMCLHTRLFNPGHGVVPGVRAETATMLEWFREKSGAGGTEDAWSVKLCRSTERATLLREAEFRRRQEEAHRLRVKARHEKEYVAQRAREVSLRSEAEAARVLAAQEAVTLHDIARSMQHWGIG